jgi:hypothetical protein
VTRGMTLFFAWRVGAFSGERVRIVADEDLSVA